MIKLQAYLTGFSSRNDGSASLRFATQELTADEFGALQKNLNTFGHLLFKENAISPVDIPTEQAEDKSKTPSKRLRSVLYLFSQQKGIPPEMFEPFYQREMEKIITHVKTLID